MIRYERKQLKKQWEIIWNILDSYKTWVLSWEKIWKKIWLLFMLLLIVLSLAYLYMWIQNAFVPYSTAWDANHEYMYIPKILAENAGVYRGNTVGNNMPWLWHQFLTFVFSLTGCTNWWFGLSSDNIAISMNNISTTLVLIFWIAIIFQIFTLVKGNEGKKEEKSELKKWKDSVTKAEISNWDWITIWWYILLLWLTSWMGAFLVIVDNKTDLWVMAISLLALLAGLIFLQNRKSSDKKEILKYVIIAWLFFGFAALAKITAFVDLVLFGLLLVWLRFWWLTSLGLWMMVMWFVRKFNILTSSTMLTNETATWLIIIGWIVTVIWLVIHLLKNSNRENFWKDFRDLIILWICFLIPLIIFKLPRATISQIKVDNYSVWNSLRAVFLSMNTVDNKKENNKKLLAQNSWINPVFYNKASDSESTYIDDTTNWNKNAQTSFSQCLKVGNIYSKDELNENLQEIIGSRWNEDLWRYIWYWWKEFKKINLSSIDGNITKTKWFAFFKLIWPEGNECSWTSNSSVCEKNLIFGLMKKLRPTSKTCYGLNHDAKVLCNNADVISNFKIDDLRWIYENWIEDKQWEAWKLLKNAIDAYNKAKSEWKLWFWTSDTAVFHDEIANLRQYYQSHSISSTENSIYIPYRYLVPLNISFNWSLQNLSSYYTDIGFFWIIVYILIIVALIYAIIKKNKLLTCISLTTIIWWLIRWIIWSSILWYGTVLISWTMITIALFWDKILQKNDKNNFNFLPWILIIIVWLFFWVQILFNFLRISSQWASSVFVWYKGNVGMEQYINDNLDQNDISKLKRWFWRKDIFDLQFAQYNPVINALKDRDNKDWVIVAWTYIQYFLWNQWNVRADSMLLRFWKNTSDWDLCKTYRRLKNDNSRYLIIDPNIWTVTMWEWNETLFYRFFGKLSEDESKIEMDWTITTLVKLYEAGYLKLLSTNNLWAKYTFVLSDDIIRQHFWENLTDEEITLIRAKIAVLKYFNDANYLFSNVVNIFISRLMSNPQDWIEDIADIYWLEVDSKKVADVANKIINLYLSWKYGEWLAKWLSQSEKTVLITYMNIYLWYKQWWESAISSQIQNLLLNSVTWGSQIIALELN